MMWDIFVHDIEFYGHGLRNRIVTFLANVLGRIYFLYVTFQIDMFVVQPRFAESIEQQYSDKKLGFLLESSGARR